MDSYPTFIFTEPHFAIMRMVNRSLGMEEHHVSQRENSDDDRPRRQRPFA
jgi:hypothetical protein